MVTGGRKLISTLILMFSIPYLLGAEIKVQDSIKIKPGRLTQLEASSDSKFPIKWINTNPDLDCLAFENGRNVVLGASLPGVYRIAAYTGDEKGPSAPVYVTVVVDGPLPPPVPPGPGPTPPGPTPTPAPIPLPGLRVLINYSEADKLKMPPAQQAILQSGLLRTYLNSKCATADDSTMKEWRIWDQGLDVSGAPKRWQDAYNRPKTSIPSILISNGTSGYEGPLPATTEETINLIKKYETSSSMKGGK